MLSLFRLFLCFAPMLLLAEDVPLPLATPEAETNRFMMEFLKMIGVLGTMVVVLLGISAYVKRLTSSNYQKENVDSIIKVIDRRSLSPRSIVYLIEVEGKSIVVGETPQGLVRLSDEK